ncbi:MAG: M3 family oligoendopeptidase [Candidatus Faecivivens sp.]|nr:M3 family oligoendopeptidase [Candidatus Faecivivens sp.]
MIMLTFAEIPYKRPDFEAVGKKIFALAEQMKTASCYEEMRSVYFQKQDVERELDEMHTVCSIRSDINTEDPFYSEERRVFNTEIPGLLPAEKAWNEAFLASPYREEFSREFGDRLFVMTENNEKVQSPVIAEELIEESQLVNEYSKIAATCKVNFRGEECNFYGLLRHMESTDREERKEAFHEWAKLYEGVSDKLDDVYYRMVQLRVKMAKKMGYDSYIPFAYLKRGRTDYTPEEVDSFRKQILEVVTPAVAKLREEQAKRLGVEKLHYYDEMIYFPEGNADPHGDRDFMVAAAQKMYGELSPETKEFFDFMVGHQLFDLETKPGKRLGGYCTSFQFGDEKAPFIFSNFNGTAADIDVLTHEAGHAFEAYVASRSIPIDSCIWSTSEINEIHSMSMETFTFPWMNLFFGEEAEKYKYIHLIDSLACMPYMCAVDEFQHKVFENPEMSGKDYRKVWHELEKKYMPWRDYDGVEFLEEGGFWMQKQHIFMYPFYYVDYALAQTCAFQFFTWMLKDREAAWNGYLKLCRSGGSRGYFETLDYAGLRNPFVSGNVEASVKGVLEYLENAEF